MYDAVLDGRTSEICKSSDGTTLAADDPFWETYTPPLHHRCLSGIISLTEAQAAERGLTKTPPKAPAASGFGLAPDTGEWEPDLKKYLPELQAAYKAERVSVAPVRVLPLRPEQVAEPLARQRFEELRNLSAEAIRAEVERAQQATFSRPKMERYHARAHGPKLGLEPGDVSAYLVLAQEVRANPERVFSARYGTATRPTAKQWIFTRENLLAIVAEYGDEFVLTTFYRATIARDSAEAIGLEDYLRGREHGRQMVEIKL